MTKGWLWDSFCGGRGIGWARDQHGQRFLVERRGPEFCTM
jgi:hypothetical protein